MIFLIAASAAPMVTPECAPLVTTYRINECEARALQKADLALNAQWKASLAAMKRRDAGVQDPRSTAPSYENALIAAQRAWLQFRDTDCRVWGYRVRGGTAESARVMACQISLTIERTQELRDQVKRY